MGSILNRHGRISTPNPLWIVLVLVLVLLAGCSSGGGDGTGGGTDTGGTATTEAAPETTTSPSSTVQSLPADLAPPPNRPEDIPPPWPAGDPALASLSFTEVTAEAGLSVPHSDLPLSAESGMTSGVTVADVDRDGDHDVFLPRVGKPDGLFLNDGSGRFTDVAEQAGVAGPPDRAGSSTAAFADFDADGHLDLFVAGAGRGANQLFMNEGDGTYVEESVARGVPSPEARLRRAGNQMHDAAVADVNRDGFMDLLVLHWHQDLFFDDEAQEVIVERFGTAGIVSTEAPFNCAAAGALRDAGFPLSDAVQPSRSALYLNDGTGNFTDATEAFDLPLNEIVAFTGVFHDLDADGWLDLMITGDTCTSRVFRNVDGERFEDITAEIGVGTDENGMGSVLTDVNRDGLVDWFVTSISYPNDDGCVVQGCSGNRLYLGDDDGRFTDATDEYGVRDGAWGWGAAIEDFDNDGTPEITMANGFEIDATFSDQLTDEVQDYFAAFVQDTTRFWVRDGTQYRDAAPALGLDATAIDHGLVAFDMDTDGDLDLLIAPSRLPPRLYRNDSPAGNHWLTVALDDPTTPGNRWGDGARIEVTPTAGSDPVVGWISTGGSYESQKPPIVHVGLGRVDGPIERIEVFWPGDDEPQVVEQVGPDQRLVIERDR